MTKDKLTGVVSITRADIWYTLQFPQRVFKSFIFHFSSFSNHCACPKGWPQNAEDQQDEHNGDHHERILVDGSQPDLMCSQEPYVSQVSSEPDKHSSDIREQPLPQSAVTSELAKHSTEVPCEFNAVKKADIPTKLKLIRTVSLHDLTNRI